MSTHSTKQAIITPLTKRHLGTALAVAALTAVTVAGAAVPATADPVGQCAPEWNLIPADSNQFTAEVDALGNEDGFVCRKLFTAGSRLGVGRIVDNRIPLHVTF